MCVGDANVLLHALGGPVMFDRGAVLACKRWPQSREIHAGRGLAFKVEFGSFYRPVFSSCSQVVLILFHF